VINGKNGEERRHHEFYAIPDGEEKNKYLVATGRGCQLQERGAKIN